MNNLKDNFIFFLECPDQTEIVIQVYLLNPLFDFVTRCIYSIVNFYRSIVLFFIRKNA